MGLNSRGATHPKMIQSAADVLSGFESCEIEIVDPNTNSGNDNFNVWTNETGSEPNVVWSGSAQMQVFRQTLTLEIPAGGMTQVRSARFTISDEVAPRSATRWHRTSRVASSCELPRWTATATPTR